MKLKLAVGGLLILAALGGGYTIFANRFVGGLHVERGAEKPTPVPASINVTDQGIIVGFRGAQASAIIDLFEAAPVLARLPESDIERLVRKFLKAKAEEWFSQDKYARVPLVSIDVVTIIKRDEYQRGDIGGALPHGHVTIRNIKGHAGEVEGKLSFANLRASRSVLAVPTASVPVQAKVENPEPRTQVSTIITPAALAAASEEILFDEVDLWQHPRSMSNLYGPFEPLRVRTKRGAEYFYRNDSVTTPFSGSGHRYGELRLHATMGSVMYLPQHVDFVGTLGYGIKVRKSDSKSRIVLRVFKNFRSVATIREGKSEAFPVLNNTNWNDVRIPFSALKFEAVEDTVQNVPSWHDPNDFLSRYDAPAGYIFAIEIGLENAAPDDALYFDRLIVLRAKTGNPVGAVHGRLLPPDKSARIHIRGRGFDQIVTADAEGQFTVQLPANVPAVEIFAETNKAMFAPLMGRFLELGSYVPSVDIPTIESQAEHFPTNVGFNSAIYEYDTPIGPHIRPGTFGFAHTVGGKVQFLLEERANKFGFLDRDRRFVNPDHAYRVVVLGDSYFLGIFNDMRDSFWNQAEAITNMLADRPVEIIPATNNYAPFITGWSEFENYALKLKPNLFVLALREPEILSFAVEDYVREWLNFSVGHPPATVFHVDQSGHLVMTPPDPEWQQYLAPMSESEKKETRARIDARQFLRPDIENAPAWTKEALKAIELGLAKFAAEGKKHGVEVAIAFTPYPAETKRLHGHGGGDVKFDPDLFENRMREIAKRAGITFIDMVPTLYKGVTDEDVLHVPGDGHWSSFAHYRAGVAFAQEVLRRLSAR